MPRGLVPHVFDDRAELAHSDTPEVVSFRPAQRRPGEQAVAVGEPSAGSFEPLDEAGDVDDRRQLQDDVDVIGDDAGLDEPRPVPLCLARENAAQKVRNGGVYQGLALEGRPGQVRVEAYRHARKVHEAGAATRANSRAVRPFIATASFRTPCR